MNIKDRVFVFPNSEKLKLITIYTIISTIVFVVVYGWCNKQAALAPVRYHLYTDWEISLPLIPWMIYPYISLNLLFLVCAFVLKENSSIKGFCVSLMVAAICAGVIFYLFPGQLGFARETVPGYEHYFDFMFSIDHPHNLFPSLHITYSSLAIFAMREQTNSKSFHYFLYIWLAAITASVVLVHQHHLFDIVTGFILAMIVYKKVYIDYYQSLKKA